MRHLLLTTMTLIAALLYSAPSQAQSEEWTRPFPPFRIIGNVYWVGSYELPTYLIATPAGHILVNTGVEHTADRIKSSVEALGFRLEDTKILTATHGHYDHVSSLAALKAITGARLLVAEQDRSLYETGGATDFRTVDTSNERFPAVAVDGTFTDGGTISLGGTTIVAHHHGGHTKGATSFTLTVRESGRDYRVIIANMPSIIPGMAVSGMASYPGITEDYARTFAAQKKMDVDVWLAAHASQFGLHRKYAPGDAYDPNRFVDPQGFRAAVLDLERAYLEQLTRERGRR
ncbi:MAG: subclass B3 metallo-beta-lactamase [Vicinamibacterales bacterium]